MRCLCYLFSAKTAMATSESKGRFFYKTNRFEAIRITNRIESIRIANWNALDHNRPTSSSHRPTRRDKTVLWRRVGLCELSITCAQVVAVLFYNAKYVSLSSFYAHDAILARVLAMALCSCPCLSLTSRCSLKWDERINMVFGMRASFDKYYFAFQGNSGIYKIRLLRSGTFS